MKKHFFYYREILGRVTTKMVTRRITQVSDKIPSALVHIKRMQSECSRSNPLSSQVDKGINSRRQQHIDNLNQRASSTYIQLVYECVFL